MTFDASFLPMALFALATSATPGPVNLISAMSGARFGTLRSLPYVLGATTSFVVILLIVGLGFQFILDVVDHLSSVLTLGGSAYMLYLAWKIAADSGDLSLDATKQRRPGFVAGLLTQAINPKAWIVSLSAVTIYVGPYIDHQARLFWFTIIFFLICSGSLASWAFLGARVARFTGNVATFNKVMAGVLALAIGIVLVDMV